MRHFLITADQTNGDVNKYVQYESDEKKVRLIADHMFTDRGFMNVEITEPLGVEIITNQGPQFEECSNIVACEAAVAAWTAEAKRKRNKGFVRSARVVGRIVKTAVATEDDKLVGAWMAAALDDRKVCPSMKFDINCWMDSKEWT